MISKKNTLALLAGLGAALTIAQQSHAIVPHLEDFDNPAWTAGQTDNWQDNGGTIARTASGTDGIASSSGAGHATISGAGPFTRFGGYVSSFGSGFVASLDVYLDPTWSDGEGFDYSVAINNQAGSHLRDWIWHVGVVAGQLLVNASNNTDFVVNAYKLQNDSGGNYGTVVSEGWYTLQQVFYDNGGTLAVDFNLLDASSSVVHSITRTSSDLIATDVGGHRYGWVTTNAVSDGLLVDNTKIEGLSASKVPDSSATLALLGSSILILLSFRRYRR